MDAHPGVDEMLRLAAQRDQQMQQAQQMLNAQLQAALDSPHATQRYRIHMSAIATEDDRTILLFGLPTGERVEFEMPAATAVQLCERDFEDARGEGRLTTWDILIPSLVHRTDKLTLLLAEPRITTAGWRGRSRVPRQREALAGVQMPSAARLVRSGLRVVPVEDDDWIHENYVGLIMHALEQEPDFVGFRLRYTESGVLQLPVVHSIHAQHNEMGDEDEPKVLYRQVTHLNPIRRTIAATASFEGDFAMDRRWSNQIVEGKLIRNEVFVDEEVYHYRHDPADSIQSGEFEPASHLPAHPDFPWVVWL